LVLTTTPEDYDDVWIIMISSKLDQAIEDFDEIISEGDPDFTNSGLKTESVVRISRVAVVERSMLEGVIGEISEERLNGIRRKLSDWLSP
jgi:mRNA interferase MazF